jgi:hypothetical protein
LLMHPDPHPLRLLFFYCSADVKKYAQIFCEKTKK